MQRPRYSGVIQPHGIQRRYLRDSDAYFYFMIRRLQYFADVVGGKYIRPKIPEFSSFFFSLQVPLLYLRRDFRRSAMRARANGITEFTMQIPTIFHIRQSNRYLQSAAPLFIYRVGIWRKKYTPRGLLREQVNSSSWITKCRLGATWRR